MMFLTAIAACAWYDEPTPVTPSSVWTNTSSSSRRCAVPMPISHASCSGTETRRVSISVIFTCDPPFDFRGTASDLEAVEHLGRRCRRTRRSAAVAAFAQHLHDARPERHDQREREQAERD